MSENRIITLPIPLEDVPGSQPSLRCIPEGHYLLKTQTVKPWKNRDGDLDSIMLVCAIRDCFDPEDFDDLEGQPFTDFIHLSERALWRLKSFMEAASGHAPTGVELDCDEWEGKHIVVRIENEIYNGAEQSKIKEFLHAKEWDRFAPPEDEDEDDVKKKVEPEPEPEPEPAPKKNAAKSEEEDDEPPKKKRRSRKIDLDDD